MLSVIYADCHLCWESLISSSCSALLCWVSLCWLSLMLIVTYKLFMLSVTMLNVFVLNVIYADCHLCWVSHKSSLCPVSLCWVTLLYDNNFRINYWYSLLRNILYFHLWNKALALSLLRYPIFHLIKSACTSLLIKILCLSKPKLPLLGLLITFVNNFQFNLVVMLTYSVNQSSVINLIKSKKLILDIMLSVMVPLITRNLVTQSQK